MMPVAGQAFRRLGRWIDRIERIVLTVLVTAMVALAAIQILLRNVFHSGLPWVEPLLGMGLLWLTMLGALAAAGLGRHLAIDLAVALLPKSASIWLGRAMSLFGSIVCVLLAWAAGRYVGFQRDMDLGQLLGWPLWKHYMVIPVAFWLIAVRFALHAVLPASWLPAKEEDGLPGEGRVPS
jgi:TRAP-type C4-dicarboxylate transport system permease small subunit